MMSTVRSKQKCAPSSESISIRKKKCPGDYGLLIKCRSINSFTIDARK